MKFNEEIDRPKRKRETKFIEERTPNKQQKKIVQIEIKGKEILEFKLAENKKNFLYHDEVDINNNTALHEKIAKKVKFRSLSDFLKTNSYLLEVSNVEGNKPLDLAVDLVSADANDHSKEVVSLLINYGAEVSPENFCRLASLVQSEDLTGEEFFDLVSEADKENSREIFSIGFYNELAEKKDYFTLKLLRELTKTKNERKSEKENIEILEKQNLNESDLKSDSEIEIEKHDKKSSFVDDVLLIDMNQERGFLQNLTKGEKASPIKNSNLLLEEEDFLKVTLNDVQNGVVDSRSIDTTSPNFGARNNRPQVKNIRKSLYNTK